MNKYKVSVCSEDGVVLIIEAKSKEDAQEQAQHIADNYAGSNYPNEYEPNTVHRDFFINEILDVHKM